MDFSLETRNGKINLMGSVRNAARHLVLHEGKEMFTTSDVAEELRKKGAHKMPYGYGKGYYTTGDVASALDGISERDPLIKKSVLPNRYEAQVESEGA